MVFLYFLYITNYTLTHKIKISTILLCRLLIDKLLQLAANKNKIHMNAKFSKICRCMYFECF